MWCTKEMCPLLKIWPNLLNSPVQQPLWVHENVLISKGVILCISILHIWFRGSIHVFIWGGGYWDWVFACREIKVYYIFKLRKILILELLMWGKLIKIRIIYYIFTLRKILILELLMWGKLIKNRISGKHVYYMYIYIIFSHDHLFFRLNWPPPFSPNCTSRAVHL